MSSLYNKDNKKINILIAEDHPITMRGLIYSIEGEYDNWHICGKAKNGGEALEVLKNHEVTIAILDIKMPLLSGMELTEIIRNDYPNTKVIIFTEAVNAYFILKLKKLNVLGFLDKGCGNEQIVEAIKAVLDKTIYFSKRIEEMKDQVAKLAAMKLTPREIETLKWLSKGHMIKEVADKMNIQKVTVDDYVKKMKKKFGVNTRTELLNAANSYGVLTSTIT